MDEQKLKDYQEYYGKNIEISSVCDKTIIEFKYSNIYVIEDIVDSELCQEIVKIINKNNRKYIKTSQTNNVECTFFTDNDILNEIYYEEYYVFSTDKPQYEKLLEMAKDKKKITVTLSNNIKKDTIIEIFEKMKEIFLLLESIIDIKKIPISFKKYDDLCFRKIHGKTNLHRDDGILNKKRLKYMFNGVTYVRVASVIITLNDDYSGGIFNFPDFDINFKLKKGSLIIFPPYWTHSHCVTSLQNNSFRYTINTWLLNDR
jgi:hypothetical protein